jgi:hypothetical protein
MQVPEAPILVAVEVVVRRTKVLKATEGQAALASSF